MGTFVPAPGVVQLDAIWTLDGQNVENVFHYKPTVSITHTLLTALANTYITWATTNHSKWGPQTQLVKLYVRDLSAAGGINAEVEPLSAVVGSATGVELPNNVSFAIARKTGLSGRANRGRIYHFGMVEDFLSGPNVIANAVAAILAGIYEDLDASQGSTNNSPSVLLHRALGTSTPITSYGWSDLFVDAQRRRLPAHNRHH